MYKPKARAQAATQVGNYAIQISFSDGHSTGIFSYDYLRTLCPCGECAKAFRDLRTSNMKKMKQSDIPKNVDEYLAGVPEPARSALQKMRKTIQAMVPLETTEAISYRMPTFRYKGGLVCYGAFADHCSFFPMDASLIVKFKKELKGYSTAKGTIRFRRTSRFRLVCCRK